MLTAAISGEIFASPSVANIMAAIKLSGPPGSQVLLIVTNYTGDRLNFGLAAEMVQNQLDYTVKMLLVNDDCSIEDTNVRRSVGRRGLAGTILIHKIAGAMSDLGKNLTEIFDFTTWILEKRKLLTVGFSFMLRQDYMTDVEIGKGLHGEPGVKTLSGQFQDFSIVIEIILEKFLKFITLRSQILVLFNNLGGVSELIFQRFIGDFLQKAEKCWFISRILQGAFFTSLNSQGISVTILDLSEQKKQLVRYLDHKIEISANFNIKSINEQNTRKIFEFNHISDSQRISQTEDTCGLARNCLKNIVKTIQVNKDLLNLMDSEFGDGDTGNLNCIGAEKVEEAIKYNQIDFTTMKSMFLSLSSELQKCMGGSFGAICCLFLQGLASAAEEEMNYVEFWRKGLAAGIDYIQRYSFAETGDRTVIDVLIPLRDFFQSFNENSADWTVLLSKLCEIADEAVENTRHIKPRSGRAAYSSSETSEFSSQYPDPGKRIFFTYITPAL